MFMKIRDAKGRFIKLLHDVRQDGKSVVNDGVADIRTNGAVKKYISVGNDGIVHLDPSVDTYIAEPSIQSFKIDAPFNITFDFSKINSDEYVEFKLILHADPPFTAVYYPKFTQEEDIALMSLYLVPGDDYDYDIYREEALRITNCQCRVLKFFSLPNVMSDTRNRLIYFDNLDGQNVSWADFDTIQDRKSL